MPEAEFLKVINGEPKEAFKSRLRQEGRFAAFIEVRERLKRNGRTPQEAWREAALLFPRTAEPAPPESAVTVEELEKMDDEVRDCQRDAGVEQEDAIEQMVIDESESHWKILAAFAQGKKAPELDAIRWVAENIQTPVNRIVRDEIPSAMAVNWLKWVRDSKANEAEFWKSSMVKLLPDRKSLEADASAMKDDGSEILDSIEKVVRARERARAQETT